MCARHHSVPSRSLWGLCGSYTLASAPKLNGRNTINQWHCLSACLVSNMACWWVQCDFGCDPGYAAQRTSAQVNAAMRRQRNGSEDSDQGSEGSTEGTLSLFGGASSVQRTSSSASSSTVRSWSSTFSTSGGSSDHSVPFLVSLPPRLAAGAPSWTKWFHKQPLKQYAPACHQHPHPQVGKNPPRFLSKPQLVCKCPPDLGNYLCTKLWVVGVVVVWGRGCLAPLQGGVGMPFGGVFAFFWVVAPLLPHQGGTLAPVIPPPCSGTRTSNVLG